jgi:transcriptional regulator with XRE-family HTH domain
MFPNLFLVMRRKHVTQLEIAKRLGLHQSTLSYKFNGHAALTPEEKQIVADMLGGYEVDWLFQEIAPPRKKAQ